MDPRHALLFEPIQVGPKTLPNRFYQVPHCTSFGTVKPRSQAHHRAVKAEGGWGVVFTEECSVSPEADQFPAVLARLWDDDDASNLALMVDMAHAAGALAGIELWYGGVHTQNLESRGVSRSVTQTDSDAYLMSPNSEMDASDIRTVQGFYVEAAKRAREVGFDIICLYGGHEGLLEQFLSPHYNKRTDEYGGTPENRARFWRDLVLQVKEEVGDDCAISIRLSADSMRGPEGIELERDVLPFIRSVDHLVDLWDVHIGGVDWGEDATPSRFFASGRALDWLKQVKQATAKPVVGVGRFTDPAFMVQCIRDGYLDIVGAARPTIADPFLPIKIKEGRLEDIRECIGCNMCISRFEQSGPPIVCTQNPTAGEEFRRGWHPEQYTPVQDPGRPALIIGAGPAGMECARVLGERGMRNVHLVDAAGEMGGHLTWLKLLPGLSEWGRVTDHRMIQIAKLPGVEFIAGTRLSAAEIMDYGAALVILATGSHWSPTGVGPLTRDGIPGADATLPHVFTPEQLVQEDKPLSGERVVIIDQDGYHVAASLADRLSVEGRKVTLLTHYSEAAPYTAYTLEANFLRRKLYRQGVTFVTSTVPVEVSQAGVWARSVYAPGVEVALYEADAVVLVTQRNSDTSLYRELTTSYDAAQRADAGIEGIFRIGDCLAPRVIAEAVFDGHRLGREIESPDPQTPLPFIRERVVEVRIRPRPAASGVVA